MTSILGPEWNLSPEGVNIVTENGSVKDYSKVLASALNTDLKEIGSPVLTKELVKDKTSKIVLQIQKIRNISAPKANEDSQAAPRMLKLNLTDGDSHVQAVEISTIGSISRNQTSPGTKILINNASIVSGYILLNSNNCKVLGGKVPHLVEKWEIAKSIQRNKRGNSPNEDGPPPWVNFGTKIQTGDQPGNFKSLGPKNKEATKEDSEFEQQRQGAIAEATAGAIRKVFGGRVKQNVQPITSNQSKPTYRSDKGKNKSRLAPKEKEVDEKPVRPSEKVSLFAFLEDKLPLSENLSTAKTNSSSEFPKSQTNANKNFSNQYRQNDYYQNYNQQSYNDKHPAMQNRYERNFQQSANTNNSFKQFDRPNNFNNYPKPAQQDRQGNSNSRQYDKPKQQNRNDFATNSKSQDNNSVTQKDVNDLASNVGKISLNSQFASRSLRQHFNLVLAKKGEEVVKQNESQNNTFNVGDECLAKYWEDGKFYNATITAITDKTYAVRFKGYGNIEEILKNDCQPLSSRHNSSQNPQSRRYDQNTRPHSGSVEFRRSNRNYK